MVYRKYVYRFIMRACQNYFSGPPECVTSIMRRSAPSMHVCTDLQDPLDRQEGDKKWYQVPRNSVVSTGLNIYIDQLFLVQLPVLCEPMCPLLSKLLSKIWCSASTACRSEDDHCTDSEALPRNWVKSVAH